MSTIERAMRKIGGEKLDSSSPPAPDPEYPASVDAESRSRETLQREESGELVRDIEHSSSVSAPIVSRDKPGLELDFDRLKQLGFLVPSESSNHMAEEFQEVKRKLIGNLVEGMNNTSAPSNLIMVTSSVPGEGKTYTSMNLALSLAKEIDRTVLAVDIDILKSDLSKLFGAYSRTGLYDYLSHPDLDISDVIFRTNLPSLSFIPAGTAREGITERLASQAMMDLTRELAARYPDRIIIFDAPPVLATTGAAALAPMVGQVILVVEAYKTTQEALRNALTALERVPIAGVVLNKIRHRTAGRSYGYGYNYGYGYGYGYGDKQAQRQQDPS